MQEERKLRDKSQARAQRLETRLRANVNEEWEITFTDDAKARKKHVEKREALEEEFGPTRWELVAKQERVRAEQERLRAERAEASLRKERERAKHQNAGEQGHMLTTTVKISETQKDSSGSEGRKPVPEDAKKSRLADFENRRMVEAVQLKMRVFTEWRTDVFTERAGRMRQALEQDLAEMREQVGKQVVDNDGHFHESEVYETQLDVMFGKL